MDCDIDNKRNHEDVQNNYTSKYKTSTCSKLFRGQLVAPSSVQSRCKKAGSFDKHTREEGNLANEGMLRSYRWFAIESRNKHIKNFELTWDLNNVLTKPHYQTTGIQNNQGNQETTTKKQKLKRLPIMKQILELEKITNKKVHLAADAQSVTNNSWDRRDQKQHTLQHFQLDLSQVHMFVTFDNDAGKSEDSKQEPDNMLNSRFNVKFAKGSILFV